jgi:signal transduction histidine kinase
MALEGARRVPNRWTGVRMDFTAHLPSAFLLVDSTGTVVYSDRGAEEMFSELSETIQGASIDVLFSNFDTSLLYEKRFASGVVTLKTPQGHKICQIQVYPIEDEEGRVLCKGIILTDVTLLKIMEERLLHREKMETLGILSAGIAHDFNNLFAVILGHTLMLKQSVPNDEKLLKRVETIERSVQRASTLIQRLLNFSRRQKRPSMQFDLHAVLDDILFLFGESFKNIEIERRFEPARFLIGGDESEFQNVFLNLFMNAKDAMDGNGRLSVETQAFVVDGKDFVRVTVEDSGKGMDAEVLERLFEPYFTTRSRDGHLGLGLFRVERTVKKYGGFVEVESQRGEGTRFYIYLPLLHSK